MIKVAVSIQSEINHELSNTFHIISNIRTCGLMDKAPDFGSDDSGLGEDAHG